MIHDLSFDEIGYVNGAGEVGDAIRAVGDAAEKILDATYDTFYDLGKSVRSLFN